MRPARRNEEPDSELVRYLTHNGQMGAKDRVCKTELDTAGVLTTHQQSAQHFRSIQCNDTLNAFKQESLMSLADAAEGYTSLVNGADAVKDEANVASAEHCELVIEMLMTWFEALNHKWQKVTADGVSTAVRNERSATFFNVVNFTLVHWHYTLASSYEGVFFNTWSKEMADVAAVADMSKYPSPPRCDDKAGAAKQVQLLKVLNSSAPASKPAPATGGAVSFDTVIATVGTLSKRQRKALAGKLGFSNGGGGGGKQRVKPEQKKQQKKKRVETRACFQCGKTGHIKQDCTQAPRDDAAEPDP